MTQIPVLSGITTDSDAEFRTSYPVNLIPVIKQTGISNGYLRPADGIILDASAPGVDRGGINWNDICYRVLGNIFCRIGSDGVITQLGTVGGGTDRAKFDYSTERLAIVCGGVAYYYDGTALSQITDPDLGTVFDVIFVDGYFMFTDGTSIIITELSNPGLIDPLKYGSAEIDPDPIQGLIKLRDEPNAIGRYTIEVFDNVGSPTGFPFERIEGAVVNRGSIGRNAHCRFGPGDIAFLGSGRNEPPSVYLASNSQSRRIATREIDKLLKQYTETQLGQTVLESRFDEGNQHLFVHLPDRTLVYDAAASAAAEEQVWFVLVTGLLGFQAYRARNLLWCYGQWLCGDPLEARIGHLTQAVSSHWGEPVRWEFSTLVIYNEGNSGIVHEMELVALTGRAAFGDEPQMSTSYSKDGLTWSQDKYIRVGRAGERRKRLVWRQQGTIGHFRVQRFQGDSESHMSIARLEAQIEALTMAVP